MIFFLFDYFQDVSCPYLGERKPRRLLSASAATDYLPKGEYLKKAEGGKKSYSNIVLHFLLWGEAGQVSECRYFAVRKSEQETKEVPYQRRDEKESYLF